jgi:hypothetical protein
MRLRQIAFVSAELDVSVASFHETFGLEVCYRDPSVAMFGLVNAILPIGGDSFVEIVQPTVDDTAAGRYLVRRGGDAGYMLLLEATDMVAVRTRLDDLGIRIVAAFEGEHHTSLQLHPKDCGGVFLSVDAAADDWAAAGPAWRDAVRLDRVSGLRAVTITCEDPSALAPRWAELTGAELAGTTLTLDDVQLRFEAAEPEGAGIAAVELQAAPGADAPTQVVCCGVRFDVVA